MPSFQLYACLLTAVWLLAVLVRFRTSRIAIVGGLLAVAGFAFAGIVAGKLSLFDLGLAPPASWLGTAAIAIVWLALMLVASPVADWIASHIFAKPPTLGVFKALQESRLKLVVGIVIAWVLGGFLEELVLRGILLQSVAALFSDAMPGIAASICGIVAAAIGAWVIHLYQGPRAAFIVAQLSVLFGLLFVVSGHDLWTVILCHGLYDTIAFIRFAMGKSKYSRAE